MGCLMFGRMNTRTAEAENIQTRTKWEEATVYNFCRSHTPHATEWLPDVRCPSRSRPSVRDKFGVGDTLMSVVLIVYLAHGPGAV